jgi:glyoxylase-like metal-dependent hydrolase (beta-lactamase superfamily II)
MRHSRRSFLGKTLGAAWTGAALLEQATWRAAAARAQSREAAGRLFDIERVGDGAWSALARPAALLNCNAAIFEMDNGLLVVDAHSKPSAAAALVAQIRRELTPKPVRYIVNTHFHWDHSQGTPAYRKAAPGASVLASEATRRLLSEEGAPRLKASLEAAAKSLDRYRERESAAGTAEHKAYWRRMAEETRAFIAEMKGYAPELPDVTLTDGMILHDKKQTLQLMFLGRAHTAGDIVVWSPTRQVAATGDLVHGFAPYIGDGYPKEWPDTLRKLAGYGFNVIAGGHGGVFNAKQRLYEKRDYIEELTLAVEGAKRRGRTLEQAQAEITPDKLKSVGGGFGRVTGETLVKYTLVEPGTTPEQAMAGALRGNVADIWRRLDAA